MQLDQKIKGFSTPRMFLIFYTPLVFRDLGVLKVCVIPQRLFFPPCGLTGLNQVSIGEASLQEYETGITSCRELSSTKQQPTWMVGMMSLFLCTIVA